ncbi:MAG: hypothetical protein WBO10_02905 [Pyrinomonadaceae bacterium]
MKTKIYIIAGVVVLAAVIGASLWANRKIAHLESEVETTRRSADESAKTAATREIEAAEYKAKIEYLEQRIVRVQTTRRKQDEELEKLNSNSNRARRDVERARRTQPDTADADELGHKCE